jgi:regulatory protein
MSVNGKMKHLEKVEKYKGRTMQLTFSEGEPAFINADTVQKYGLRGGIDIPESAWEEIVHADTYRRARERAMYLLDYRDYSYVELVKKLMNNYEEDICFEVADNLAELGFINDERYAETLARRQFEVKLFGAYRVKMYLREKGIPAAVIEEALEPYEDEAAERAAELVKRRYMKYYDPDDRALMQKLKNALARQGYSYGEIKEAIELLAEEFEEED